MEYISKRLFFSVKKPHSGIKKWQLISVSFLLFRFRQTYTRNGNETSPRQRKKELIILIKSIFNMETKNKLRTSNENPATQNQIIRKSQKETSFWLLSYRVLVSFFCVSVFFPHRLGNSSALLLLCLTFILFLHLKLLKTRILLKNAMAEETRIYNSKNERSRKLKCQSLPRIFLFVFKL